jgi:tripartite-type tricarboxylate transporter receptor subunit TctC
MKGEKMKVKVLIGAIILFVSFITPCAAAEDPAKFPSRPISMLIAFNPGSSTDLTGRKLADLAGKILGQPIVAENNPGGAGVIAVNTVAKAPPDGYTIGAVTSSATVVAPHFRSVPYKTTEDFTFLILYLEQALPFGVRSDARWKTYRDFMEEARKNPGKLTYAHSGPGSSTHIIMEQAAMAENVKLTDVPTSQGAETVSYILGGHVDSAIAQILGLHIRAGKVRGLAVAAEKRMSACPDVPTFYELLGNKVQSPLLWNGLIGPKGMDPRILKKLSDAFKKAYEDPSFQALLVKLEQTPMYKDPESFRQQVVKDFDLQGKIAKQIGLIK